MSNTPIQGIGFVDKAEICKRRAVTAFNKEFAVSNNREKAYEKSTNSLERCIYTNSIKNPRAVAGLKAELLYYYFNFDSQHLAAESASGLHSDFRAVINGIPSAIDVTTNPLYKENQKFQKIENNSDDPWKYFVGVVDLNNVDAKTYPLLLPRCKDGHLGHFILATYDADSKPFAGIPVSDTQILIKYNPYASDDDSSVEEIINSWNFIITQPARNFEDDLMVETWIPPKSRLNETQSYKTLLKVGSKVAYEFKRESGFIISAIVSLTNTDPVNDGQVVSRFDWVHPHPYVRNTLGKPLDYMGHNVVEIAG